MTTHICFFISGAVIGSCLMFFWYGLIDIWRCHRRYKKLREISDQEAWEEWKEAR